MESSRIAEFLMSHIVGLTLPPGIYDQLGIYLDLLLRWNARTNLTAIRDPEQIVTRHFGESLFAARVLFASKVPFPMSSSPAELSGVEGPAASDDWQLTTGTCQTTLADLGSGAGFPGLPIKLAFPHLHVTLIESQNKKATFLKEVIRTLHLEAIEVYSGRAEHWGNQADIVTLRAVDKFESVLRTAAALTGPGGRVCALVGHAQAKIIAKMPDFTIQVEQSIPGRTDSCVVVGKVAGHG